MKDYICVKFILLFENITVINTNIFSKKNDIIFTNQFI